MRQKTLKEKTKMSFTVATSAKSKEPIEFSWSKWLEGSNKKRTQDEKLTQVKKKIRTVKFLQKVREQKLGAA